MIIREGQTDGLAIFLPRQGAVAVRKRVGQEARRISAIEAVYFFGEMAVISGSAGW